MQINEKYGIENFDNEEYHNSLKNAASDIIISLRELINNKIPFDTIINQYVNKKSYNNNIYAKRIIIDIKGLDWINNITVYLTLFNYTDGVLLGDTETLSDVDKNLYLPIENINDMPTISSQSKYIPLKIKNDKITECNILLYLIGNEDIFEIETLIDHEIGHARDILLFKTDGIIGINGDIIDDEFLYSEFQNFNTDDIWKIPLKYTYSITLIENNDICCGDICKWFTENIQLLNSSEIRQHRKNFYLELKKNKNIFYRPSRLTPREIMRRCSEDYRNYDAISIILKFLKEYMPIDLKRKFYNEFVSLYINRDRGNERRRYIYGKQFLGRNKNGGSAAVNEFFDFLIKNIDEYYIERCRRLYNALSPNKTKRLDMSLNSMISEAQNKYFIDIAEEELLTDL